MLDGYLICDVIRQNEVFIMCLLEGASKSVQGTSAQSQICDVLA
jgi:hypothetical protein